MAAAALAMPAFGVGPGQIPALLHKAYAAADNLRALKPASWSLDRKLAIDS